MSVVGNSPSISTENPMSIKIVEKAEFDNYCIPLCFDKDRFYFYALENGYTFNFPSACFGIPPNCICPGYDHIYQTYFDRGLYDRQTPAWKLKCLSGDSVIVPNDVKFMCCCSECGPDHSCGCLYTPCIANNGWGFGVWCLFTICGIDIPDRIRFMPFEYFCCCCPNRACFINNCCGLCGPKDGEPLLMFMVFPACCLRKGTADSLALAMNNSRAEWKRRTNYIE